MRVHVGMLAGARPARGAGGGHALVSRCDGVWNGVAPKFASARQSESGALELRPLHAVAGCRKRSVGACELCSQIYRLLVIYVFIAVSTAALLFLPKCQQSAASWCLMVPHVPLEALSLFFLIFTAVDPTAHTPVSAEPETRACEPAVPLAACAVRRSPMRSDTAQVCDLPHRLCRDSRGAIRGECRWIPIPTSAPTLVHQSARLRGVSDH